MGQIHGDNLGSPVAIVTPRGELLITGSLTTREIGTQEENVSASRFLLENILDEVKIIRVHMENVNGEIFKREDTKEG